MIVVCFCTKEVSRASAVVLFISQGAVAIGAFKKVFARIIFISAAINN